MVVQSCKSGGAPSFEKEKVVETHSRNMALFVTCNMYTYMYVQIMHSFGAALAMDLNGTIGPFTRELAICIVSGLCCCCVAALLVSV